MTESKKTKKTENTPLIGIDLSFGEALERFLQTDPKELASAIEKTKRRSDEIERSAAERRERLRSAAKGPAKKFSL
ncbi:hypothetical protein SS37A_22030 [Methylocystis iwaonis]|uniref:Uncharacterized protein n=1 Tax=Methylocystis iwaonis TaxID=2885079 RepID=A0ABM8E9K0_9HYPH|nr:hypothetical protein SS37A_22030 [Methylocystis iwaonis]